MITGPPKLVSGTIETLLVDVEDELENMVTLTGSGAVFDVKDRLGNYMMTNVGVTVDSEFPMRAECLVNTALPTPWASGKYYLYLRYTANPDAPTLGGLEFHVND